MRALRRGVPVFRAKFILCGIICLLTVTGRIGRGLAQTPAPSQTLAASAAGPLYRIVGYEQREEAIYKPSEIRAVLGPAGYRQWVASRVLIILGGVAAFSGSIALLATLGSLGQNTNYGTTVQLGYGGSYRSYVNGFAGLLAAGGGLVVTGLVLSIPLPPRRRTLLVPQLQIVESPRF